MFSTLLGLPAHPLFVHAAVGLVPLTAILTAWSAWLAPARRRVVALPLMVLNLVTLAVAFVTKESGEALEHSMPREPLIEAHAQLGDLLPLFAGLMFVLSLVLWSLARRGVPHRDTAEAAGSAGATATAGSRRSGLQTTLALVTLVCALLTCWWTFRVGHSGAQSVWGDVQVTQSRSGGEGD